MPLEQKWLYDQMQMNVFADIHEGSQMFHANKDLKAYGYLKHFWNANSHQMSFRTCIVNISDILLDIANGIDNNSACMVVRL
jgi:hypothetical protein